MPEITEGDVQGLCADKFNKEQPPSNKILEGVYIDATTEEGKAAPMDSLAASGHVYELKSSMDVLRGQTTQQTGVYPPMYADPHDKPISSHGLVLSDVAIDPRNVILKFYDNKQNEAWVQIQLLKHTVLQIYTLKDWSGAICCVPRMTRGFRVGIAFRFKSHVMAFLTLDLLLQVYWGKSRDKLPAQHPDIYLEYRRFLTELVAWMKSRRGSSNPATIKPRSGNAMSVIRSSGIFPGVGVYTISEVFHRAGLSPFLTEAEVFDCPSRTARLCAALYHFAKLAHTDVWTLVQQHMQGYVIAVARSDRLKYANMLLVYGKARASVSERFHMLWKAYQAFISKRLTIPEIWVRKSDQSPFDIFEPTLVQHALERQDLNPGPLIFGKELWQKLCIAEGLLCSHVSDDDDPLAEYFQTFKLSNLWLQESIYDRLFLCGSELKPRRINIAAYRASHSDIWSVYPLFPKFSVQYLAPNLAPNPKKKKTKTQTTSKVIEYDITEATQPPKGVEVYTSDEKKKHLLSYQTQCTGLYTVGPLDYCGIAQLIPGRGESKMLVCNNDPRQNSFYIKRSAIGKETAKLKGKGLEKQGLPRITKRKVLKDLPLGSTNMTAPSAPKRRRLSADKVLALQNNV